MTLTSSFLVAQEGGKFVANESQLNLGMSVLFFTAFLCFLCSGLGWNRVSYCPNKWNSFILLCLTLLEGAVGFRLFIYPSCKLLKCFLSECICVRTWEQRHTGLCLRSWDSPSGSSVDLGPFPCLGGGPGGSSSCGYDSQVKRWVFSQREACWR